MVILIEQGALAGWSKHPAPIYRNFENRHFSLLDVFVIMFINIIRR